MTPSRKTSRTGTRQLKIHDRLIAEGQPPYVIAEISANHNGSQDSAYALIAAAKYAGADAVKFQAYTPDTITMDCSGPGFSINSGPWKGHTLYSLYGAAYTPFEWFPGLFKEARRMAITPFASVFDKSSVDMLEGLGCEAYKIASFELVDIPLIRYTASFKKPMILSTGLASYAEINDADDAIPEEVSRAFLHCVSGYPTPIWQANLRDLNDLRNRMHAPVGLSDHSAGATVAIAAAAFGACIIEKHLTLSKDGGGPDDFFSMEPDEFKAMVNGVREAFDATRTKLPVSEETNRPYRRSLYVSKDIKAGDLITEDNIRSIRPGYGLQPKMWDAVIGNVAVRDAARGEPLSLSILGWAHQERQLDAPLPNGGVSGL